MHLAFEWRFRNVEITFTFCRVRSDPAIHSFSYITSIDTNVLAILGTAVLNSTWFSICCFDENSASLTESGIDE